MVSLRRRLGVRLRSALAAGLVVAVAALAAGGVLLVVARGILMDDVTATATDRADQIAAAVRNGNTAVLAVTPGRALVQVIGGSGQVTVASSAAAGAQPLSALRPPAGQRAWETRHLELDQDAPFRVLAVGVTTAAGTETVLVAESLDTVDDATEAIVAALTIGMPLLALVVATATFVFVGRTLRPVQAMTRQAATITATNLHARLPVPVADDEIAALAATMNTMLDRIETASVVQRRFVADASHELRSPLATIHANAELLRRADLADAPARSVARIRRESTRMATLVEDLLLLARVDNHALPLRHDEVDLDDLVYAERERTALEHPGLRVEGEVSPVRVLGDPDHLHRALRNLVDNAVRHAERCVLISLTANDGSAELVIGNDGPVIADRDRERIFGRFLRLDDSRSRQGGGTGLGLPIARDIAAAHGGTLTVDARTEGAALRLRLPTAATVVEFGLRTPGDDD
ncbi:cell wall metabolism sensor histidine kinase WalK [Actinoplanes sp. N902-109]|uniref:sensor histidine kinase n=1 Tax=Actinoplanes sp. (strain N902-109) TaxID=649831 RepID=UPI0005A13201|nr:HAMP domain-containing sensor histidine kinase [Actinoplanes sp. N902-109]